LQKKFKKGKAESIGEKGKNYMPAVKYSHNYTPIQEQEIPSKGRYQSVPIKKEHENKNVKKAPKNKIAALNFALISIGCVLTVVFTVIYSIVALSETKLSNLHAQISELNYENIELENKLENVKSYYSVDTKVSSTADFDKAKNVIEVNHVNTKMKPHTEPKTSNLNTVTGF